MVTDIDIISYTNCGRQSNEFPQESGHGSLRMAALKTRKSFRPTETVDVQDRWKIKKAGWPLFIEKPFAVEMEIIRKRSYFLKQNLIRDLFLGHAFTYPFIGVFDLITHKIYWGPLLIFGGCYICVFVIVATLYYIFIIPIVLAWALITLGPLGVILGHVQWILQTNALTSMICGKIILTHLGNQIFDIALQLNGQADFLREAKFIKEGKKDNCSFFQSFGKTWQVALPLFLIHCLRKIFILAALTLISLIPLLGPMVANQLLSGRRAFCYMSRYFALKGDCAKANKDLQYERLGLFFTFGMTAGLLEFIPFFSVVTITSNTIGAAKWSTYFLKEDQN